MTHHVRFRVSGPVDQVTRFLTQYPNCSLHQGGVVLDGNMLNFVVNVELESIQGVDEMKAFAVSLGFQVLDVKVAFSPNATLTAAFLADKNEGAAPLTVQFQDLSVTGDPFGVLAWVWFIDGDEIPDSNHQNPTWTFDKPGTYEVKLLVLDHSGNRSWEVQKNCITVT